MFFYNINLPQANFLIDFFLPQANFFTDNLAFYLGHKLQKKINLDKLKESILLQSEILDLKASFSDQARGVVIESKIDKRIIFS